MQTKKVAILWSGGLDSTFLVYDNLRRGNEVTVFYNRLNNNQEKTDLEIKSIVKNSKLFSEDFTNSFHSNIGEPFQDFHYLIADRVIDSYFAFKQAPLWLLSAAYIGASHRAFKEVQIAYVMSDQAISYIEEFKRIYNSYKLLCDDLPYAELLFPLIKTQKKSIVQDLPLKYLKNIWFCEEPLKVPESLQEEFLDKEYIPCSNCDPCKRFNTIVDFSKFYDELKQEVVFSEESWKLIFALENKEKNDGRN